MLWMQCTICYIIGTAKNVTQIWCESGLLSPRDLQTIQNNVNAINVPVLIYLLVIMGLQLTSGIIGHVYSLQLF